MGKSHFELDWERVRGANGVGTAQDPLVCSGIDFGESRPLAEAAVGGAFGDTERLDARTERGDDASIRDDFGAE